MSKYNKFEDFMQTVINEADRKCRYRHNKSLNDAFRISAKTISAVKTIIENGWWVLVALVVVLSLGSVGFGLSIVAFAATPAGIIVVGVLAACGIGGLRALYNERALPIAVKEVGEYYKSDFNNHKNETSYIDNLVDKASDRLLNRALFR